MSNHDNSPKTSYKAHNRSGGVVGTGVSYATVMQWVEMPRGTSLVKIMVNAYML